MKKETIHILDRKEKTLSDIKIRSMQIEQSSHCGTGIHKNKQKDNKCIRRQNKNICRNYND